ncbi:uncharacterized protein APUU_61230S [Aspergillus puulaauensis]|uniref:Carboxylic ester hydrolase n=1 Tax=Aspergillus puulaauensis TaxID=1220207 RepID=A0A7R8ARJ6_9EURO|nr:uncharacterized protein APUU_61230S [Aspergillus puulaauensis]BCS28182.1 hypothetical protein APUU_61230S [Aspergillus puulaauensis]
MERSLSTADVPRQFLKTCFLTGHVPLKALASDPRVSYALYIPPSHYNASHTRTKLPLLVWIHGTGRRLSALYEEELVSFADRTPCAILAPLFPAGLDGPNDLDSYKKLRSPSLRSDQALLSILDEIAPRWPEIQTDRIFMMGFSGGGQFAHRFLYLYPERLAAVSVGAPGRVTMLDFSQKWPVGVEDAEALFGRPVGLNRIQKVAIQLVVGSEDNWIHGSKEFWTWLQKYRNKAGGPQGPGSLDTMDQGRLQTLVDLHSAWKRHGVESQLEIVQGISHEAGRARKHMLHFLEPLIRGF